MIKDVVTSRMSNEDEEVLGFLMLVMNVLDSDTINDGTMTIKMAAQTSAVIH